MVPRLACAALRTELIPTTAPAGRVEREDKDESGLSIMAS